MAELVVSVEVDAPAAATWAAITEWERQEEWIPLTRVRPVRGSGREEGDRIVARTAAGPVGFDDPMEITVWDPPRRCEVRHLGRVVRGVGVFEVEPLAGDRSRFTWAEFIELPAGLLGQLGFVAVRPVAAAALEAALHRFARRVTAR